MSMIKILNSELKRKKVLKKAIDPNRFEEINGENILSFSAVLDAKTSMYLDENAVIELDDDYFDVAYLKKAQNQDGTLTIEVESEHVSYRLNDPEYNLDTFAATGTPTEVLTQILTGTGFTVGTVEMTGSVTYSAQEKKSRRMILMEFVNLLGGEANFNKFSISIVQHRGDIKPKLLAKGKNIKVVSKIVNKRERDAEGNPLKSYICEPIMLPDKPLSLGDEVILTQKDLGIKEQLRIVRIGYNPYEMREAEIELANFISGLEDDIYRIQTTTVSKNKVYNGCKIGPDEGFVAMRSDKSVKSVLNATEGISIQFSDDAGNTWEAVFYVSIVDGVPKLYLAGAAEFEGNINTDKSATIGELLKLISPTNTFNSGIKMIAEDGVTELAQILRVNDILLIQNGGTGDVQLISGGDVYLMPKPTTGSNILTANSYIGSKSVNNLIATQGWVEGKNYAVESNVTASFETADGKTVLVHDGVITDVF